MSSTRSPNSIDAFAMDAFRVSMELCAVSEHDAPGVRATAIRKGRRSYETLVQTRESLCLSGADACTTEHMLEAIHARLEYLCEVTFRRNQWRWRREESKKQEVADTGVNIPHNMLATPSKPRWWRSYTMSAR